MLTLNFFSLNADVEEDDLLGVGLQAVGEAPGASVGVVPLGAALFTFSPLL